MLQTTARLAADFIGRESSIIRLLRPVLDSTLDHLSFGRGVARTMNGATFRVEAQHRHHFPPRYDPELAALLRQRVYSNATCVNVGANLGIYTLQLARWSAPLGRVIAFEPNPEARRVLAHHVRLNGCASRVRIESSAVGRRSEKAFLYAADYDGMSRLGKPNKAIASKTVEIPVEVVRLDDFCGQNNIKPDVLVMDIEGAEIEALHGATELIRGLGERLSVFVEMHPEVWEPDNADHLQIETLLKHLRRRILPLSGQIDPLRDYGQVELVYCG